MKETRQYMKILITGASGFVGSSFMATYENIHEIYGIGRKKLDRKNYFSIDLTQPFELDITPDVVIHCAAKSSPWGTYEEFYKQNVISTQNVIDFCKRKGVKKLIYISSSSVFYKNEDQYDIDQYTAFGKDFVNDYAKTKYLGEQLVKEQYASHVILRPRAVYGQGDTVLFPRILVAAKKGKLPQIIGKEVIGDLIYIDNVTYYMLQACEKDVKGEFNLTDGKPVNIYTFLKTILNKLNIDVQFKPVSIEKAMFFAGLIEWFYRLFALKTEPPITKFGVGVFAYSKTFNPLKTYKQLGIPPYTTEEGVERFVAWQLTQNNHNKK